MRRGSGAYLLALIAALTALLVAVASLKAGSASPRYPDLRTVAASDLVLGTEPVGDAVHYVVRFSTVVWNAGEGPLELHGAAADGPTPVYQRVYDEAGTAREFLAGTFAFDEKHGHWHFENFARYELWTRASYDRWISSGRADGQAEWVGSKTTGLGESFCIRDSGPAHQVPGGPLAPVYDGCNTDTQGLSVDWADRYSRDLPDQWVDVGLEALPDGDYVLRLIADPLNLIYESEAKADPERESPQANEAVTAFTSSAGQFTIRPI